MNSEWLKAIRLAECSHIISHIPPNAKILEIGAGAGWQAEYMKNLGYEVEAVDIEYGIYSSIKIFPIKNYNGRDLPYSNDRFDLIFSSNVLEHVIEIDDLMREMRRVLKPGGVAIHLMPSVSWRIFTIATHYIFLIKYVLLFMTRNPIEKNGISSNYVKASLSEKIIRILVPRRHGECGNFVSEIFLYSRRRWLKAFSRHGWKVIGGGGSAIFYTGYSVSGSIISLKIRKLLSRVFGSGSEIYVVIDNAK
jgi:SAM-dependent methyltransferase